MQNSTVFHPVSMIELQYIADNLNNVNGEWFTWQCQKNKGKSFKILNKTLFY